MIYRHLLVCFLFILIPLSAKALPPPSPAEGNYLVLDGVDDHAVLDNDAKTVALWHFDEPGGTAEFLDASGNAYHLLGKNGAQTGIPLSVEAAGKLATTWARLKR